MLYLHLPNQQQDTSTQNSLITKNDKLHVQRIRQVEDNTFEFIEIPMDAAEFKKVVDQALLPNNNYVPGDYEICGIQSVAITYVVDKSQPAQMESRSREEAFTYLRGEDNSGLGIRVILEDTDFQYVLEKESLKKILIFLNRNPKLLQQQIGPAIDAKCKGHYLTSQFQCCGQCEVCHCAE